MIRSGKVGQKKWLQEIVYGLHDAFFKPAVAKQQASSNNSIRNAVSPTHSDKTYAHKIIPR